MPFGSEKSSRSRDTRFDRPSRHLGSSGSAKPAKPLTLVFGPTGRGTLIATNLAVRGVVPDHLRNDRAVASGPVRDRLDIDAAQAPPSFSNTPSFSQLNIMIAPSGTRILELIEWLASQARPATLAETRLALDLPKSSTLVLLRTLVEAGYAGRGDDGRYRLLRLPGEATAARNAWGTIVRITEPFLREAVVATGESGFVAVMTAERRIRYVHKQVPQREIRYDRNITIDRAAHHVSSGVAILAATSDVDIDGYVADLAQAGAFELPERRAFMKAIAAARREGIAINLKGRIEGAGGVAAAILDRDGQPVAAFNIAGPAERIAARLDAVVAAAREGARLASRELGRRLAVARDIPAAGRAGQSRGPASRAQDIRR
jgi:IclR family transcriptional regulator, acetate operon repressor